MDDNWAENELFTLYTGDARTDKRAKKILEAFGKNPGAPISQVFKSWGEIKAAYRFFSSARITPKKILDPHSVATVRRIKAHRVVLLPADTTSGDYTGKPSIDGLGRISANQNGENLGIFVHPTLALTPERLCLGVVGAKIWTRSIKKKHYQEVRKRIGQSKKKKYIVG